MAFKDLVPWSRSRTDVPVRRGDDFFTSPFVSLRENMNRMFDDFFGGMDLQPSSGFDRSFGTMVPRLDLDETDEAYVMTAEMPGLDEKDIDVNLTDDVLTIRGRKQHEEKDEREGYRSTRRSYGSFHRSLRLPAGVDRDSIRAELSKGVLTLTLPKSEESRQSTRRIEVHSK